jgi:hypothetical protein
MTRCYAPIKDGGNAPALLQGDASSQRRLRVLLGPFLELPPWDNDEPAAADHTKVRVT